MFFDDLLNITAYFFILFSWKLFCYELIVVPEKLDLLLYLDLI